MSEIVKLDHYRERAEKEHGDKSVQLADGTVVTLVRPLRMAKEQRERMYAAQAAVRDAYKDPPAVEKAREAYMQAVNDREKLSEAAGKATIDRHDGRVAQAAEKLTATIAEHGEPPGTKDERLFAALDELVTAIADTPEHARALLDEVNDNQYVLQMLVEDWQKETEPGEAPPSPS